MGVKISAYRGAPIKTFDSFPEIWNQVSRGFGSLKKDKTQIKRCIPATKIQREWGRLELKSRKTKRWKDHISSSPVWMHETVCMHTA